MSSAEVYGSLSADPDPDDETDLQIDDGEVDPRRRFSVDPALAGERLDKALVRWMPDISRTRLKQWVEDGAVRVNGAVVRPRHELGTGDLVELEPQPAPDAKAYQPEPMSLAVLFEDADMLVIDKPPGLVVHPAAGHWSGTLLNGLLAYAPELADVPRAGIVHRLDAGTSGLMVVARTLAAQADLVRQLQARTVRREYWAIVLGEPRRHGTSMRRLDVIRATLCASRSATRPMRVRRVRSTGTWRRCVRATRPCPGSRAASIPAARTRYACISSISATRCSAIRSTGAGCRRRTRQLHGVPFGRQALHACRLGLEHPRTRVPMQWFRAPPADLAELMQSLGFGPTDRPATLPGNA